MGTGWSRSRIKNGLFPVKINSFVIVFVSFPWPSRRRRSILVPSPWRESRVTKMERYLRFPNVHVKVPERYLTFPWLSNAVSIASALRSKASCVPKRSLNFITVLWRSKAFYSILSLSVIKFKGRLGRQDALERKGDAIGTGLVKRRREKCVTLIFVVRMFFCLKSPLKWFRQLSR